MTPLDLVEAARTVTVVGLAKNAGKTTVVNHLLARLPGRLGLASLGLEGEARVQLTGLPKPRVFRPPGAIVATAEGLLEPGAAVREVACEGLVRVAQEQQADAILVSRVVTQKQVHARQLTKLVDLLEAEGLRDRFLLICGGPRLSNTFAKELGYDAGFGPGARPSHVAAWLAEELIQPKGE